MSPQTLTANLEGLRNFRSVFGVVFSRGDEVIFSDASVPGESLAEMAITLDDIAYYFKDEDRDPDQLAFGYDGGNLLVILDVRFRLVVLHHNHDDVDIIAHAANSFLKDYRIGLIAERVSLGDTVEEAAISAEARQAIDAPLSGEPPPQPSDRGQKTVDPTQPISPITS